MARLPREAFMLAGEARDLEQRLRQAVTRADGGCSRILGAVSALRQREIQRLLENIPVEELNRDHRGIRVKTLRDGGYENVAQLLAASARSVADLNGISDAGAAEIRERAGALAEQAAQGVRLRLSLDDKSPEATCLVEEVSRYRRSLEDSRAGHGLLQNYGNRLREAAAAVEQSRGALKWLFQSKEKRDKASAGCEALKNLMGSFGPAARTCIGNLEALSGPCDGWEDFSRNSIDFFNILEQLAPGLFGSDRGTWGLPEDLAQAIAREPILTEGLKCTLRRYQEWGVRYILHQKRVLLGDEMGLGKTVQAIAVLVSLRNSGATHFLVVCPASVLENWCRELRKHSDLTVLKVHGDRRQEALEDWMTEGGVAVTTYETTGLFTLPEDFSLSAFVVDEAHYVKNPQARRSKNVRAICEKSDRVLFMTGTALENRVDEMITLMEVLQPEVAGSVRGMASLSAAPQFREAVAPVYYRRKREDVLTELPDLIETEEWCELGPAERKVYETAVLEGHFTEARRVSWSAPDLEHSCKARRLLELIEEAEEEGRKVIVFSFFLDTIARVISMLGDRCMEPINGSVPPRRRQEIVDEFDQAPPGAVLPAQIQAGGTGLNIQSASVVILCEPQFKPSIEHQAISRAYRMGQTRNVLVYRLLCQDSVDEGITELLEQKQEAFDAFADESVLGRESLELDAGSFGTLMQEETARIRAKNPQPPEPQPPAEPQPLAEPPLQ